jgi:predicted nucleic acid-binding protein
VTYRFDEFLSDVEHLRSALLDTSACVYFLNEVAPWAALVRIVLERADRGLLAILIPSVVHMELLAKAFEDEDELERRRVGFFVTGTRFIREVAFDTRAMVTSAEMRAKFRLKLPDAIVIGSACVEGVDAIVGNDGRFRRLRESTPLLTTLGPSGRVPRYIHLDEYIEGD